jgi:cytochrome bd-type quinol oxidase subunit 2
MKKLTHILITLTFAFACLSLWAMLTTVGQASANGSEILPGFTRFCLGWSSLLLMLPVPVVGYCLYALFRRQQTEQSSTTFLAWTMSALCLVFFPVLMAVFLPCLRAIGK